MITTYKLIKEYPGSPCKGTLRPAIVDKGRVVTSTTSELYHIYPEFWEEVKDYEILSFKIDKDAYAGQVNNKEGKFTGYYGIPNISLEKALEKWPIYSIKRNSDGEIFTVGDTIVPTDNRYFDQHMDYSINTSGSWSDKYYPTELMQFKITNEGLACKFKGGCGQLLSHVEKYEKSTILFTTEDGVGIKADDPCFEVSLGTIFKYMPWRKYYGNKGVPLAGNMMFSTEEKAKEYISNNGPKYSEQNIREIGKSLGMTENLLNSLVFFLKKC